MVYTCSVYWSNERICNVNSMPFLLMFNHFHTISSKRLFRLHHHKKHSNTVNLMKSHTYLLHFDNNKKTTTKNTNECLEWLCFELLAAQVERVTIITKIFEYITIGPRHKSFCWPFTLCLKQHTQRHTGTRTSAYMKCSIDKNKWWTAMHLITGLITQISVSFYFVVVVFGFGFGFVCVYRCLCLWAMVNQLQKRLWNVTMYIKHAKWLQKRTPS